MTDEAQSQGDPWHWTVAWFAQHHGQAFSAAALDAALPARSDLADPGTLARGLTAIGLRSLMIDRKAKALDPSTLPCLAYRKDGSAIIICALSENRRFVTLLDPLENGLGSEVPMRKLMRQLTGKVLLIAPERAAFDGRLDPNSAAERTHQHHWFWGPVRRNSGAWTQIIIAALCLNLLNLALPIFVMNVYDRVIPNLAFVTLWTLTIGVSIALILDFLMRLVRAATLERLSARVDLHASQSLFRQAMDAHLLARPGGAAGLAHRIREFEIVREFFASATFVALIDLLFIGVFVLAMWFIVGPIAMVPLIGVGVALMFAVLAQLPMGKRVGLAQSLAAKRHTVLMETLNGIETIKSVGAEPVMQREWENAVAASSQLNGEMRHYATLATYGTMLVQQVVSVSIIVWGVFLVFDGAITVGALIAANLLAGRVLAPLGAITQTIFRTQHAFRALRSLSEFMKLPGERGAEIRSGLRVMRGQVALDNVSFGYPGTDHPALAQISLRIEPGETVALLGRVGAGKSTLGRVLTGLLTPQTGQVLIDGLALPQYDPAELRGGIGYMPQHPDLFTGTIRENLTMGLSNARDEDIRVALYQAGMDEFVDGLADGMNYFVGERGQRLSGGQRQGLALARLVLRKPKFLFLDEPTNMMDQPMEAVVIDRLRHLSSTGIGIVISTHRHSLAEMADRFIVLERGRKVLDGPKGDVMAQLRSGARLKVEVQ